jgi:hypothetical protein
MKKMLTFAEVLSWVILVLSGILVLFGLLATMASPNLQTLTAVVLASSIILHSYAALQLRKSLINPQVPLSKNTTVGIRFMGLMAFFYAVMNAGYGLAILQHSKEFLNQIKFPAGFENFPLVLILRIGVGLSFLFCAAIIVNVVLNLRLLAWWHRSQNQPKG